MTTTQPPKPPPRAATAAHPIPPITYPEALPVSALRGEIARAIRDNPVVVVCGETGSGKTTQLPKIVLELGRGRGAGGRGLIGHTQPRRIAASSVAKRIAQELDSPLGEVVGYQVRFQDRLQPGASVKLMTDGILLAETERDPLLSAYDTIIIDEAHERSLNIDFLLGYLRRLLEGPRRDDLKVVVTSATIDADRFARHFDLGHGKGPAPVIMVSGRLFPVEQRWRPFDDPDAPPAAAAAAPKKAPPEGRPAERRRDADVEVAIADAVDELWRGNAAGDILVFLPGEREIRDAADHLRKHLASTARGGAAGAGPRGGAAGAGLLRGPVPEILPLFARLSQAEQDRVFEPADARHGGRRIVLATNVAETSLTVPGIRYVVDTGLARVKRYSFRNKVEQLQVEPISQAAAAQRAGRCGRVAGGICIRLYGEDDFASRPAYTDPEILRSSLAGVILRMKALRLGAVEDFPFIEPPPRKAIADGYALLAELGAVDDANELTPVGRELARLPLDPRVGRMILEARDRHALAEVLVIAAALSGQDVRDRPIEHAQAADEKQKPFDDERSEFVGTLKLWDWIEEGRGHAPPAAGLSPSSAAAGLSPSPAERERAGVRVQRVHPTHPHPNPLPHPEAKPSAPRAGEGARQAGADARQAREGARHKLTNRQQEQRLRERYISPRRVREWRDIHSQLHTVAAEHGWRLNTAPASYEQIHLSLLAGLLGNVGVKADDDEWYLGARGIKFWRHPGAHLSKKPGRWVVAAELVETTRLFGRGLAAIDPRWIPPLAGHLLKTQLLEPHWEKKAGEVVALERATLYGIVVYNDRRVNYAKVDLPGAREIFIRQALVDGDWDERHAARLPFLAHNRKLVAQVQELEHKARRQDVLVDEDLIHAWYDQHLPADVASAAALERWYRDESKRRPDVLKLTRDELMRHEAAGITTDAYPRTLRLGGIDCAASYLHEPGEAKDGVSVTVPIYALNQVSEERCEWLVPGMLAAKVLALVKTLHQRPRSRLVPLPEFAAEFCESVPFGDGSLVDALLKAVRERTQLAVQRNDFKLEQLSAHLFMNFRVVDEHGRQLGMGRDLAGLKAELGGQARSAFQALAALKLPAAAAATKDSGPAPSPPPRQRARGEAPSPAKRERAGGEGAGEHRGPPTPSPQPSPAGRERGQDSAAAAERERGQDSAAAAAQESGQSQRYTAWTFGELPELMEIRRGGQSLIGYPALIDRGDAVEIEVFDEPQAAAARHRAGLRRLVALQLREPIKYLEKNIPGLQAMAGHYLSLGTLEELRSQIVEVALDRAFLAEPLPTDEAGFKLRLEQGRSRLTLVAQEVARQAAAVLAEAVAAQRKLKDSRPPRDVADDVQAQLQRLVGKRFLAETPWPALQHLPRYLKGIQLRLDKLRADPARDAARLAELRPLEQRWLRRVAELKGAPHARLDDYRWLLEELRVSLFAQELRTPQPVSAKRLDKAWAQLSA